MTRDPLVIVATLSLAGLAFFLLIEHVPKWLRALASSKPFDGIRAALAPIALPGWIKALGVLAWSALLVTLLPGMFFVILAGLAKLPGITPETAPDLRWYLLTLTAITAALGAIIALPFTLRRTVQNERQTRTQEEGYVTQQINSAVANLAAQKEVNKLGRTTTVQRGPGETEYIYNFFEVDSASGTHVDESNFDPDPENEVVVTHSPWENVTLTEPNIEVRIGAILALERLARQRANDAIGSSVRTDDGILDHDGARDHVRIMEILCAYIRENAPAARARSLELKLWPEFTEDAGAVEMANYQELCNELREEWSTEIQSWKRDHPGPRSDIQTALRVLGRRTPTQRTCEGAETLDSKNLSGTEITRARWHGYRLDLRQTDFQLADFAHSADRPLTLAYARLEGAQIQGARLWGAQMQGADLRQAQMQGAGLRFRTRSCLKPEDDGCSQRDG